MGRVGVSPCSTHPLPCTGHQLPCTPSPAHAPVEGSISLMRKRSVLVKRPSAKLPGGRASTTYVWPAPWPDPSWGITASGSTSSSLNSSCFEGREGVWCLFVIADVWGSGGWMQSAGAYAAQLCCCHPACCLRRPQPTPLPPICSSSRQLTASARSTVTLTASSTCWEMEGAAGGSRER